MVSWDDVLFGVLTGGAYNAAKGAAQAGAAAGKIGDDLGKAVTLTTEKALNLLDEITAFVTELEHQMVIKRLTPRNENDLWDEDRQRLTDLKNLLTIYEAEYKKFGGQDTNYDTLVQSIVDMMMGNIAPKLGQFAIKILVIRQAIDDIYYHEPGVIPETIYQVKSVIERFNTLEQPRIETLMDITHDTIEEGNEILVEVKKLFIIRQYKEKSLTSLSAEDKAQHIRLMTMRAHYNDLIAKNSVLAGSLQQGLADVRISGPMLPTGAAIPGVLPAPGQPGSFAASGPAKVKIPLTGVSVSPVVLENSPVQVKNSKIDALLAANTTVQGRLVFFERERLKLDKSLFKLTNELVEVPGVIPNTLDEVYLITKRFRTEEQPRIEKLMDSSNATIVETTTVLKSVDLTVLESKKLLAQANANLQMFQGWLVFLSKFRIPILIGCGCMVLLVIAIMVMVLVVLVKMAFF
jgi:hypothetical protein